MVQGQVTVKAGILHMHINNTLAKKMCRFSLEENYIKTSIIPPMHVDVWTFLILQQI